MTGTQQLRRRFVIGAMLWISFGSMLSLVNLLWIQLELDRDILSKLGFEVIANRFAYYFLNVLPGVGAYVLATAALERLPGKQSGLARIVLRVGIFYTLMLLAFHWGVFFPKSFTSFPLDWYFTFGISTVLMLFLPNARAVFFGSR